MSKNEPNGCGCTSIPLSVILLFMGGGYWLYNSQYKDFLISQSIVLFKETISLAKQIPIPAEVEKYIPEVFLKTTITATTPPVATNPTNQPTKSTPVKPVVPSKKPSVQSSRSSPSSLNKAWQNKAMRGIYLSRYAITNNASEESIRSQVRYFRSQGINTIIHGVWGNACTMYKSQVMQKTFGYASCPNLFQDNWLNWLIDEANKQGMQVHAYFEKGIKIDENSPIFDLAVQRRWIVAGVDRTHPGVDHYVLDVEIPEVAEFFKNILVEFVQKYPKIDAVQWDDYLGYYAQLPGKVDRTASLTKFVKNMISQMKKANPTVKFDICHHNPYWSKEYFATDWQNWNVDRVFIQVYNENNFQQELEYVKQYDGIAITERQFHHLANLVKNPQIKSIFIFPLSGKPKETATQVKNLMR
jgi:uncharacterized lipoprotein YddW (UPF0748 family)